MNIIEKTDEEILAVANPFWNDLVKYSNNKATYTEYLLNAYKGLFKQNKKPT
jgi:hypothetical protein